MDVIKAIRTEPVVADFLVQPVPDKIIRNIVEAGHRAQNNYNSKAWRFIVVRDLDFLRALSPCARHSGLMADAAFTVIPVTGDMDLLLEGQIIAYMQLAAWDFGIGSYLCPIIDSELFRMLLHIPDNLVFNTAISFGIPISLPVRSKNPRNTAIDDVVKWEHW